MINTQEIRVRVSCYEEIANYIDTSIAATCARLEALGALHKMALDYYQELNDALFKPNTKIIEDREERNYIYNYFDRLDNLLTMLEGLSN